MTVRAMDSPHASAEPRDDMTVVLKFRVLGSKFGPVHVTLDTGEALALVEEIEAAVEALDAKA